MQLISVLLLIVGFVSLIFGANKLVDGASAIAAKYGIPSIVIGLTIVAFGTSAPELVVNIFAAIDNNSSIVLGNVLGSSIFNALGILGICALVYPLSVKTNTTWYEIPLSLLASVAVLIVASDAFFDQTENSISTSDALILLLFFIVFLVYNIGVSKKNTLEEEVLIVKNYSSLKSLLYIILGLGGLVVGGHLIVDSATSIAVSIGLSERVIGLTIVSIGTSLPELATSLAAVRKKHVDMAIGNVVGSNIFNIFFILGISASITPIAVQEDAYIDIFLNILASVLLFAFVFTGKDRKIERWEGAILLLIYIVYLVFLLLS